MAITKNKFNQIRFILVLPICLSFLPLISCATKDVNNKLEEGLNYIESVSKGDKSKSLTVGEITAGFKEALNIGTGDVVTQLGQVDGFNTDTAIRVLLPSEFDDIRKFLKKIGLSSLTDDLEVKLNRAAETATPKAKSIFWQAITDMTFDDIMSIYKGPDDSATRYFQAKMTPLLVQAMRPIISDSLSNVGAIAAYDKVQKQSQLSPFLPNIKTDLTDHVLNKSLDGIFYYIAREEASIRTNPAKRTTELLKRVFG